MNDDRLLEEANALRRRELELAERQFRVLATAASTAVLGLVGVALLCLGAYGLWRLDLPWAGAIRVTSGVAAFGFGVAALVEKPLYFFSAFLAMVFVCGLTF